MSSIELFPNKLVKKYCDRVKQSLSDVRRNSHHDRDLFSKEFKLPFCESKFILKHCLLLNTLFADTVDIGDPRYYVSIIIEIKQISLSEKWEQIQYDILQKLKTC